MIFWNRNFKNNNSIKPKQKYKNKKKNDEITTINVCFEKF